MPVRVTLPRSGRKTGCYGLQMPDGTKYDAKPGGTVTVEDHHAAQIRSSGNGQLGIISGQSSFATGTSRKGRWCEACRRLWHAWSVTCPRCGGDTSPEE